MRSAPAKGVRGISLIGGCSIPETPKVGQDIAIRIVDAPEGRRLNQHYRGKDYATNVLSFPVELPEGLPVDVSQSLLGDLLICAPIVAREAGELTWSKPWDTVLEWTPPHAKWFQGGQLNASVNCVDRHIHGPRRNKAADPLQSFADGQAPAPPGDAELQAWLDTHRDEYAIEPSCALRQLYFDPARRGARLADADLFNADVWVGQQAVDLGLADGVAHLVPKLKALYGDKVRLQPMGQKRGLLSRLRVHLAEDMLSTVEERAMRAHFGM